MNRQRSTPEIDELVNALLEATGQLSEIAAHMVASSEAGFSSPDALPPAEVLRNLLADTLANARPGFAPVDVRRATLVLKRTTRTVAEEIYLVAFDEPGDDAEAA